jgi:SAM-dependent methyltransferase
LFFVEKDNDTDIIGTPEFRVCVEILATSSLPGLDFNPFNVPEIDRMSQATVPPKPARAQNMSRADALLRRIAPSTAILSYSRLFKIAGYVSDFGFRLLFPEFKKLPPNHLRVRVGVRNRLFLNQVGCLTSGVNYWLNAFATDLCKLNSNIVEIGCGYGRKAVTLRDFSVQGRRFEGQYVGIDIDQELLDFASSHFPKDQFRFLKSPHVSKTYQDPALGRSKSESVSRDTQLFQSEILSGTQDFVYSTSLFTHLLEPDLVDYLKLSYRVLRPGGTMLMNYFCMDHMNKHHLLGERWTFQHRMGAAYVESVKYPEAAVAYEKAHIESLCRDIGFEHVESITDETGQTRQSHLRCRR